MSHIGILIRKTRLKKNISQVFIGKQLGYTSQFIANWERGASFPPNKKLKKLAKVLGLHPLDIYKSLMSDYGDILARYLEI